MTNETRYVTDEQIEDTLANYFAIDFFSTGSIAGEAKDLFAGIRNIVERAALAAAPTDQAGAQSMRCPRGGGSCAIASCLEEQACTAPREQADQAGEREAFVKHMGYDRPEFDCAAQEVWDFHRKTWNTARATRTAPAGEAQPDAWIIEAKRLFCDAIDKTVTWARGPKYHEQELANRTATLDAEKALFDHFETRITCASATPAGAGKLTTEQYEAIEAALKGVVYNGKKHAPVLRAILAARADDQEAK